MSRYTRTYYYAVLGAIGGLIGWQFSDLLGLSFVTNLYMSEAIVGALVGLIIGLCIGITEGLLTRNVVQAFKSALFGALLGMVAGAIGLPLSEFLFQAVGAGVIGRAIGWGVFGLLLGLAEGVVGKSQAWKGMLGGLIGGALGGILLESVHNWLKDPITGKAAGLILLGACVGAFISLIVGVLSRAWLEVVSGKLKGTEFILDKFMRAGGPAVAIGSSPLKSEIVLPDPDIAPQHAMLTGDGSRFTLKDMSLAGTLINGKKIELAQLANGQKIRMGNTDMVYHEKEVTMQKNLYRIFLTWSLLLVLISLPPRPAFAQSDVQVRITQVDNSKFPNVTVYVSVTNAAGEPVGVDAKTIQITENGVVMQLTDIRGGGAGQGQAEASTTMMVVDISGSMDKNGKLQAAKDAAKAYVNQLREGDQAGLITFDTQVYTPQAITSDKAALNSAIDGLKTGGDTAMYDAMIEAEKALSGVSGRKSIIVLTDGLDNRSANNADAVIQQIGPAGLTISTIGFGDASTATQSGLDERALKSLAEKSGGLYSYAADAQALSALYQQYGRALQSEYAITYVSPANLRDGVNRNLNVSLSESGVSVDSQYNPGGVLPEVAGKSATMFIMILGALLLLLIVPLVISRLGGIGGGTKSKGRIKMDKPSGQRPNIKLKG